MQGEGNVTVENQGWQRRIRTRKEEPTREFPIPRIGGQKKKNRNTIQGEGRGAGRGG